MLTRRSFLKALAALAGVSVVPALGVVLPNVPEPVKWVVEKSDYDFTLGVAGQWIVGDSMFRNAVQVSMADMRTIGINEKETVENCKQVLRQWYYERHVLKKAA